VSSSPRGAHAETPLPCISETTDSMSWLLFIFIFRGTRKGTAGQRDGGRQAQPRNKSERTGPLSAQAPRLSPANRRWRPQARRQPQRHSPEPVSVVQPDECICGQQAERQRANKPLVHAFWLDHLGGRCRAAQRSPRWQALRGFP